MVHEISCKPGAANGWLRLAVVSTPGCNAGISLMPSDSLPALHVSTVGALGTVPVFLMEAVNVAGCPTAITARAALIFSTARFAIDSPSVPALTTRRYIGGDDFLAMSRTADHAPDAS